MDESVDQVLSREAKAIVALAFRNGPIEGVHGGKDCKSCAGKSGYSRITQDEMKSIMKNAVNHVYRLLRMKLHDKQEYDRQIAFGARYTELWDDPEEVQVRLKD